MQVQDLKEELQLATGEERTDELTPEEQEKYVLGYKLIAALLMLLFFYHPFKGAVNWCKPISRTAARKQSW